MNEQFSLLLNLHLIVLIKIPRRYFVQDFLLFSFHSYADVVSNLDKQIHPLSTNKSIISVARAHC